MDIPGIGDPQALDEGFPRRSDLKVMLEGEWVEAGALVIICVRI